MDFKLLDRSHYNISQVKSFIGIGDRRLDGIFKTLGIGMTKQGKGLLITKEEFANVINYVNKTPAIGVKPAIKVNRPEKISETGSPKIRLSLKQIELAAWAGVQRQANRISKGQFNHDWQSHVEGCLGEFAVAQFLGKHWDGNIGLPGPGDVGSKIEVRTTPLLDGRLLINEHDQTNANWVLVCGSNGDYILVGWLEGILAKVDKYWAKISANNTKEMYCIPQSELKPMHWLKG